MGDIPYWTSGEGVTIKDKDEERTEKVLKTIKEQGDDNTAHIIDSIRLKNESVMNALKLIFAMLIISLLSNTFLLLVLCYSLEVFE